MHVISRFFGAIALVALAACGGGSGGGGGGLVAVPDNMTDAWGKAHLELPVVGATVELQDAQGVPLEGQEKGVTGTGGIFRVPYSPMNPPRVRVAINGGTYDGKPFTDKLLLDVENFERGKTLLYVNALTTLISHYKVRNPSVPLETAAAKVQKYLQVPVKPDAAIIVANPYQTYFHHEAFLKAAQTSGHSNLGGYMDTLAAQVHAGAGPNSFARPQVAGVEDVLLKFAEGLVENLADEGFGWVFEAVMSALGIGGNSEVLKELHQISAELQKLEDEVTALTESLLDEKIKTLASTLVNPISAIKNASATFDTIAQAIDQLPKCPRDKQNKITDPVCAAAREAQAVPLKAWADSTIVDIQNAVTGIGTLVLEIQTLQLPSGSDEDGLLILWADYFDKPKLFDVSGADPRLRKITDYYQYAQVMGAHLLVQASMGQYAETQTQAFKTQAMTTALNATKQIKAQSAQVALSYFTNPDVAWDRTTKLVWMRAPFSNMPRPWDLSNAWLYSYRAGLLCEGLASDKFAGSSNWRLPSSDELTGLVNKEGSPLQKDHAGPGVFDWLIEQGFTSAGNTTERNLRGVVQEASYLSNYVSGSGAGHYSWALYDDRLDWVCNNEGAVQCELGTREQMSTRVGAWCVAEDPAFEPLSRELKPVNPAWTPLTPPVAPVSPT